MPIQHGEYDGKPAVRIGAYPGSTQGTVSKEGKSTIIIITPPKIDTKNITTPITPEDKEQNYFTPPVTAIAPSVPSQKLLSRTISIPLAQLVRANDTFISAEGDTIYDSNCWKNFSASGIAALFNYGFVPNAGGAATEQKFVLGGGTSGGASYLIFTSTDGNIWNAVLIDNGGSANREVAGILHNGTYWLLRINNSATVCVVSLDGINWTKYTTASGITGVFTHGALFIGFSTTTLKSSPNGNVWTAVPTTIPSGGFANFISNGAIVCGFCLGNKQIYYGTGNLATWTLSDLTLATISYSGLKSSFANGKIIFSFLNLTLGSIQISISTNGQNFSNFYVSDALVGLSEFSASAITYLTNVIYFKGKYILAVVRQTGGTKSSAGVFTSEDLITWQYFPITQTNDAKYALNSTAFTALVANSNSICLLGGSNLYQQPVILVSADGTSWVTS